MPESRKPYPNNLLYDGPSTEVEPLRRSQKIIRRVGVTLLAASALIGAGGEYYADDPAIGPRLGIGYFTDNGCDVVPQSVRATVDNNLALPTDPRLSKLDSLEDYDEWSERYHEFVAKAATESGFTLIDERPYDAKIAAATSPDEVMNHLNDYMTQFGIKVSMPEHATLKDIGLGMDTINRNDLDLARLQAGARGLMGAMYFSPVEVIRLGGIHEIKVVESLDPILISLNPGGVAHPVNHTMYVTRTSFEAADFEFFMHETGHAVDYEACGFWGYKRDPEFRALNGSTFKYGAKPFNPQVIFNQFDRSHVVSAYGETGVEEDKAELYKVLLNGLDQDLIDPKSDILRSKYRLLLSRLENRLPGITLYLTRITGRLKPGETPEF